MQDTLHNGVAMKPYDLLIYLPHRIDDIAENVAPMNTNDVAGSGICYL